MFKQEKRTLTHYSRTCTAARQEGAETRGGERQSALWRIVHRDEAAEQAATKRTRPVGGTSWDQLGAAAQGAVHFCYYSSFQRTISKVTIVKGKTPLGMGRQKADLRDLTLCLDLQASTKITSSV